MDSVDPMDMKDRKLSDEPSPTQSRIETELPSRATP
jgi:hypothetical protein